MKNYSLFSVFAFFVGLLSTVFTQFIMPVVWAALMGIALGAVLAVIVHLIVKPNA